MTAEQDQKVIALSQQIWDLAAVALREEKVANPPLWDEIDHARHPAVCVAMRAVLRSLLPVVSAAQRLSEPTGKIDASPKE